MNNKLVCILYYVILFVGCNLTLQSCTDENDTVVMPGTENLLQLSVVDMQEVQVRGVAGDPDVAAYLTKWYDIYIYRGADKDAGPIYHVRKEKVSGDLPGMSGDGTRTPYMSLGTMPQDGDRIYVFLNCDQEANGLNDGISENGLKNVVVDPFPSNAESPSSDYVPYSGCVTWKSGKDNLCQLYRLCAKVRINNMATSPGSISFSVTGISICNMPERSYLLGGHSPVYTESGGGTGANCGPVVNDGWRGNEQGIDILEYRSSVHTVRDGGSTLASGKFDPRRMALVLHCSYQDPDNAATVSPSYYRLDFYDKDKAEYMDIIRGCRYTFNITKVYSRGYSNIEEALNMPGSNLEYEVEVNDDWSVVHEYNGQYQVSVDKDTIKLLAGITDPVFAVKVGLENNVSGEVDFTKLKSCSIRLVDENYNGLSTDVIQLWHYTTVGSEEKAIKVNANAMDASALTGTAWQFCCTTDAAAFTERTKYALEVTMGNIVKYIPIKCLPAASLERLDKSETSNCYIVSPLGGKYSFDGTVMGNGIRGITVADTFENVEGKKLTPGNVNDALIPGPPVSAKLLWQDKQGLISQVAYNGDSGRVEFVIPGTLTGNAVIAVYDKPDPNAEDAKILWSWHIWCTPYSADTFVQGESEADNFIIMDRNIGATELEEGGLHYQYGRKDPYIDCSRGSSAKIYDILGVDRTNLITLITDRNKVQSHAERILSPLTYGQKISLMETFYSMNLNTWGRETLDADAISNDVKTIYDPCPLGYKVSDMHPYKLLRDKFFLTGNMEASEDYKIGISFPTSPRKLHFPSGGSIFSELKTPRMVCWTTGHYSTNETEPSLITKDYHAVFIYTRDLYFIDGELISTWLIKELTHFGIHDTSLIPVRCISE